MKWVNAGQCAACGRLQQMLSVFVVVVAVHHLECLLLLSCQQLPGKLPERKTLRSHDGWDHTGLSLLGQSPQQPPLRDLTSFFCHFLQSLCPKWHPRCGHHQHCHQGCHLWVLSQSVNDLSPSLLLKGRAAHPRSCSLPRGSVSNARMWRPSLMGQPWWGHGSSVGSTEAITYFNRIAA